MPALSLRQAASALMLIASTAPALATENLALENAAPAPQAVVHAAPDARAGVAALNLDLSQGASRSFAVQPQQVFGTMVHIGVPAATAAAGPTFPRPNARSSATFEPAATTGGLGLANVAWLGLQQLGGRAD
ncbi:hypothetical protein [uncultured Pseudacidovorax sp.]|nr:hypothetical protein [uncultured Pseudacidovorax sp.]